MMVTERGLLKLSAIGTVIGLALLYFIALNLEVKTVGIGEVSGDFVGKVVNVTGVVDGLKKTDTGLFFNLVEKEKKVKVVAWNSLVEEMGLKGYDAKKIIDGAKLNLVGLVQTYKGSLEIVVTKPEMKAL